MFIYIVPCVYLQDANDIYLCKMCTESLILAYSFWQKVKQSEEKLINESEQKLFNESERECIEINDMQYTIEHIDMKQSDKSRDSEPLQDATVDEPKRKKFRKRKTKSNVSVAIASDTSTTVEQSAPLNNIAFPHFVIANMDRESNADITNDEIYCDDGNVDAGDGNVQRKQVKTLKPSAIIPSDLNKINELLSMPPLENDTDTDNKLTIFKCSHCPKAYASPHHLMVHMRKSHLCQYCLATFSKITDLYGHVKEEHRTFECLLCSKEFQSNGNLRQHLRKNHSIFLPAHISLLSVSNVNDSDAH